MWHLLMALQAMPAEAIHSQQASGSIQLLRRGEQTTLSMRVPVPPNRAWSIITNYTKTLGAMPDVVSVELVSRQNQTVRLHQVLQAPYTFGLRIETLLEGKEDPDELQLNYWLVRGEFIRALSGRWALTPESGGTRVVHTIRLRPDVPSLLLESFRSLHDTSLRENFKTLRQLMLAPTPRSQRLSKTRAMISTRPNPLNSNAKAWPVTSPSGWSDSSWGLTRRSASNDTLKKANKRLLHSQP